MEDLDRIAAYLAGDLDPAARAAVEEEIARDPELRARVAAMRRADDALAGLRSPEPPAGFEQRLQDRLEPVLAAELGVSGSRTADEVATGGTFDELASRRAARAAGSRSRWMPAFAGVAAAALAVVVITQVGGGDDDAPSAAMDMADTDDAGDAGEAEIFAEEESAEADLAVPLPEGPVIVTSDRSFDEEEFDLLLGAPDLTGVTDQHLDPGAGDVVAAEWGAAFGVSPATTMQAPDDDAAADEAEPEDGADELADDDGAVAGRSVDPAPLRQAGDRELTAAEQDDITRCLAEIVDESPSVIPAYVEFGSYDGQDVIVFGLVTVDPATGAFTRPEIWVTGRDAECSTRYLSLQ